MPPLTLENKGLGPFTAGVIDRAEASQNLAGAARALQNLRFTGANRLSIRPGTRVVLTCKDDAGTPATVTSICAIVPFTDGALIVAHSTNTNKAYLYRLNATLDTWTDGTGTTHATASPEPVGVLWSSIPDAPDVTIAEGLGVAYLCHSAALDATTLGFPMKSFDDATRAIATVTSDLDGDTTAEDLYFRGCVSFEQHLWAWSFGAGTTAANGFRPELARFSQPNFATSPNLFATADSITLGNRVRSLREGIVGGFVAGSALFLGAPYLVTRVTGYGRSSWFKQPLDSSYGFVGPKCGVAVGRMLYYWSPRGPMRVGAVTDPEPLFDAIANVVESVVNPQTIVAGFDIQTDTVIFAFDTGSDCRTWAGYDVRRDVWVGPNNDFGLALRAMGTVSPIYASTVAASLGPKAAPTTAVTSAIGSTTATAGWTAGDATSPSSVEIRVQGTTPWTVSGTPGAGVVSFTFTGLAANVAYEWRVAHVKDGATSTYLGPVTGSQFTTGSTSTALLPPTGMSLSFNGAYTITVYWTNSGESDVSTEVWMSSDGGTTYHQQTVANPGESSANVDVSASGDYYFRLRSTKTGFADSNYTPPDDIVVSVFI